MRITNVFQNEDLNNMTTIDDIEKSKGKIYLSRIVDNTAMNTIIKSTDTQTVNTQTVNTQTVGIKPDEKLIILDTVDHEQYKQLLHTYLHTHIQNVIGNGKSEYANNRSNEGRVKNISYENSDGYCKSERKNNDKRIY